MAIIHSVEGRWDGWAGVEGGKVMEYELAILRPRHHLYIISTSKSLTIVAWSEMIVMKV